MESVDSLYTTIAGVGAAIVAVAGSFATGSLIILRAERRAAYDLKEMHDGQIAHLNCRLREEECERSRIRARFKIFYDVESCLQLPPPSWDRLYVSWEAEAAGIDREIFQDEVCKTLTAIEGYWKETPSNLRQNWLESEFTQKAVSNGQDNLAHRRADYKNILSEAQRSTEEHLFHYKSQHIAHEAEPLRLRTMKVKNTAYVELIVAFLLFAVIVIATVIFPIWALAYHTQIYRAEKMDFAFWALVGSFGITFVILLVGVIFMKSRHGTDNQR